MKRNLLILALALFAGAATAQAADKAPDFSLPNLNSETVKLSSVYPNGPVVLSFWATWCVPCPEEMKHLQLLLEKYRDKGLQVLATAIDGSKTVAKVRPFVTGRRFAFPVLLDTSNEVKQLYHVSVVPTVFLINRAGEIAYHHVGYRPGDEVALEREIQKVLAAAAIVPTGQPPAESAGQTPAAASGEPPAKIDSENETPSAPDSEAQPGH